MIRAFGVSAQQTTAGKQSFPEDCKGRCMKFATPNYKDNTVYPSVATDR
jgi:hypothetical protein